MASPFWTMPARVASVLDNAGGCGIFVSESILILNDACGCGILVLEGACGCSLHFDFEKALLARLLPLPTSFYSWQGGSEGK